MSDIINLGRARKTKARDRKEQQAAENRRKFGRTKAEKQKETLEAEKLKRHLDATEREKE